MSRPYSVVPFEDGFNLLDDEHGSTPDWKRVVATVHGRDAESERRAYAMAAAMQLLDFAWGGMCLAHKTGHSLAEHCPARSEVGSFTWCQLPRELILAATPLNDPEDAEVTA